MNLTEIDPDNATEETVHSAALAMIRRSSLADFHSSIEWAQWCRDVATAACDGDTDRLMQLEKEITP